MGSTADVRGAFGGIGGAVLAVPSPDSWCGADATASEERARLGADRGDEPGEDLRAEGGR